MKDGFDYNVPESPRDCCAGMSRHGRLTQQATDELPRATPRKKAEPVPSEPVTAPRE